ncbi:phage head closure protein [Lysinibacillus sp. RC79]|uniref:phage head closure protein n=1 Tax=Lysinibacillus sp. RC79 TaxID=3156296 RepID=UPI003516AB68
MRRNRVIYLIPTHIEKDSIGNKKEIFEEPRKKLAEKKSVRQSEFYQAATTDFKPEIIFKIWTHEYKGEKFLSYNNQTYHIIRTYEKSFRELELVCEVKINDKSKH